MEYVLKMLLVFLNAFAKINITIFHSAKMKLAIVHQIQLVYLQVNFALFIQVNNPSFSYLQNLFESEFLILIPLIMFLCFYLDQADF